MGTEEMEAVIVAGVLRRAGADVTLASVEDGLEVEASCGSRIVADTHIASCADQMFDLVALPVTHSLFFYRPTVRGIDGSCGAYCIEDRN